MTAALNHLRNPHFSGESDKVLWFSGTNDVTVVELSNLKMSEIKNFLPSMGAGKDSIGFRALMKDSGRTILISFLLDTAMGLAYLNKTVREPNIYVLTEILPSCRLDSQSQTALCDGPWF